MISIHAKDIATIVGMIAAVIYFYYKVLSGSQSINMSLSIDNERTNINNEKDLVLINLTLDKGENGSLSIHDIQAKISSLIDNEEEIVKFKGFRRQDWNENKEINWNSHRNNDNKNKNLKKKLLFWNSFNTNTHTIRISPGEKLKFACAAKVLKNTPCFIEVAVLGQRDFSPFISQWKSSVVSKATYSEQ